jgi:hypothetical protein
MFNDGVGGGVANGAGKSLGYQGSMPNLGLGSLQQRQHQDVLGNGMNVYGAQQQSRLSNMPAAMPGGGGVAYSGGLNGAYAPVGFIGGMNGGAGYGPGIGMNGAYGMDAAYGSLGGMPVPMPMPMPNSHGQLDMVERWRQGVMP